MTFPKDTKPIGYCVWISPTKLAACAKKTPSSFPVWAEPQEAEAAPVDHLRGLELTEWERSKLAWHASSSAMTYISHHVTGRHGKSGLRPDEIEEMERWKALSDKLKASAASEGSTDGN